MRGTAHAMVFISPQAAASTGVLRYSDSNDRETFLLQRSTKHMEHSNSLITAHTVE